MLTGLTPLSHGLVGAHRGLSTEVETLADWFKAAGWKTSAIVNTLFLRREKHGVTRGFEDYLAISRSDYKQKEPSSWVTDEAILRVEDQGDTPLLLFVHYYDVHADYTSLESYEKLFVGPYSGQADGSAWQLMRANFEAEHIEGCLADFHPDRCEYGSKEIPRRIDASMERITFNEEDIRHLNNLYDGGVRQMDSELGRFFSFLEESGRTKDTVVLITSDHGEEFMEHGRVDHYLAMYRESLQVPLLLRGPGVPAGERFDQPVSLIDVAPTLLSLARLPIPKKIEGYDLSQLWQGGAVSDWKGRLLFGEASGGLEYAQSFPGMYPIYRSVREGRYKLIERQIGMQKDYELFDLNEDPDEQRNLARMEPAIQARLRAYLEERAQAEARSPVGTEVELEPSEREELRALGYVP
jgi:arylsulfatase A-like enzyme